jgi:hypothetical protein
MKPEKPSARPVPRIRIQHTPPSHGWLSLQLSVGDRHVSIDASDVPNNPVQELVDALDLAASGASAQVWWHLEPDGWFMSFEPDGDDVRLQLDFAPHSERSRAQPALRLRGPRAEILLPFWRFLRDFQSRAYPEPHWPAVDYRRMPAIKNRLGNS